MTALMKPALTRILRDRRARWETKQLARFAEQGKTPIKDWQKKYPEPVAPNTSELPELSQVMGVKANVVFFDNAPKDGRVHTQGIWFHDLRTSKHFTLKTRTLKAEDPQDFADCYHAENRRQRQGRASASDTSATTSWWPATTTLKIAVFVSRLCDTTRGSAPICMCHAVSARRHEVARFDSLSISVLSRPAPQVLADHAA